MERTIRAGGVFGSSGGSPDLQEARRSREAEREARRAKPKSTKECKARLLKLLGARDYSIAVMRGKLLKAGFSPSQVEAAIEMAVNARLMDDARYMRLYIESKAELGWGRSKIERELQKQGIDCASAPGYPYDLFPEAGELEKAVRCLASHKTKAKDEYAAHYRYLMSKGFEPEVCARALRELARR